jgi:hypothetical protein
MGKLPGGFSRMALLETLKLLSFDVISRTQRRGERQFL